MDQLETTVSAERFPMSTAMFYCMRVPEFAAQALVRLRPTLAKSAVAVLEGVPPLEKTCAASLQARHAGVHHGMTRTELESLPKVTVLRRSSVEEQSALHALLEMAARFTPRVEIFSRAPALMLALDMTGSARLLGSPNVIGQKLFHSARELGFFVRVASSCNLQTAACLVRAQEDAIVVVPPGEEQVRLSQLPLAALAPSEELLDTLHTWGLRTAGDLAALQATDLIARLGQQGHQLHRLACGQEMHFLVPEEISSELEERLVFDSPLDNLDSLLFVLSPMLEQLIQRAHKRGLQIASLSVQLQLERPCDTSDRHCDTDCETNADVPVHARTLKPALPVADRALLLKLLQLDLISHPPPAAIVAVTLQADPGPRPSVQTGLFSPQSPEPMHLEVTLARIKTLVGEGRVGRAVLQDAHRAESFRVDVFCAEPVDQPRCRLHRLSDSSSGEDVPRTGVALRRLRPAPPVNVELQAGRLLSFSVHHSAVGSLQYMIRRAFGPWYRSGHWWSGGAWSMEEWDVEAHASDGSQLFALLSNDKLQLRWQLEALYD